MNLPVNWQPMIDLVDRLGGARIAIVGDSIVDHYMFGDVERLSQEAPLPIVDIRTEQYRLGGAANVALNLLTLRAHPVLFSAVGEDLGGELFLDYCADAGIGTSGIQREAGRTTSIKLRIFAKGHQVARADRETTDPVTRETETRLLELLLASRDSFDAVILQDYNKGVLTPSLIRAVISGCGEKGIPVYVDPKFANIHAFAHATVFKPNRRELSIALGEALTGEAAIHDACIRLKEQLRCEAVLATLSDEGMALLDERDDYARIPTMVRDVRDTSGAGDTVIAALAVARHAGADLRTAAVIANHAAGIICEKVGVATVSVEELLTGIKEAAARAQAEA